MLGRRVRHPLLPVALSGLILVLAHLHGYLVVVLPVLPLLLLLFSLLSGVYPGCETIVRLAERIAVRPKKPAGGANQPRPVPPRCGAATGGLLIAFGLAQRPPPLAA